MKKIIFAVILGLSTVWQVQTVCAQVNETVSDSSAGAQMMSKKLSTSGKSDNKQITQSGIRFVRKTKSGKVEGKIIANKDVISSVTEAMNNPDTKMIGIILNSGGNNNISVSEKNNNLLSAKWWKSATLEKVKQEIAEGADVNTGGNDKNSKGDLITDVSPLMFAVKYGNPSAEIIRTLIDAGADVNAKNNNGSTVLNYAVSFNPEPEIIELLLKNGADVNAKWRNGWTSLMSAARNNVNYEVVEMLLKNGADVNAKTDEGFTVLMLAAGFNQNPEVIELLLKNDADINVRKNGSFTALDAASGNPNPTIREILQKYTIEIVKVYDCPTGNYHKLCGIFENKTLNKHTAKVQVNYYDEDGIKVEKTVSSYAEIDPYGKAKFETYGFSGHFDHYTMELDILR